MRHPLLATLVLGYALLAPSAHAAAPDDDSKPEIEVYLIEPKDGAAVSNPVRVVFGLRGMGVAPAGVNALNTGHHHLLIDTDLPRKGVSASGPLSAADIRGARGRGYGMALRCGSAVP